VPSVLITGTSSGIGKEAAVELARRGWRVFATMRDPGKAGDLKAAAAAMGVDERIEVVRLDVTDPASVRAAVAATLAATGGTLDAVVNNAGISAAGAFEDLPEAAVRRVMETNFFGILALAREVLPVFRARRGGRLVMVTSEAAFFGLPANGVYSASKWAVEGWAESLAYDVAPFGIEVILVEPGPYRTAIWGSAERFLPEVSAYRPLIREIFRAGDLHAATVARDPAEVGRAIARALEAPRPRFRNPVGPFARLNHALRGKLPSRVLRWVISRHLGISRIRL
jgi:NAD(P)-dependent dehydrogenase (short-subunit alcohol dehydrogenase family)